MPEIARREEVFAVSQGMPPDPTEGFEEPPGRHPSGLEPPNGSWRRRGRWVWVSAVIVVVGLLATLFAYGLSNDPTLIHSPLVGQKAPDFDLRTLDGTGRLRLSSLRGQVVVVNFWASWCPPCRVEHPALEAAWERFRDEGVVVVGVAFQDRSSNALSFMQQLGGDWPVLQDPHSRTALAFGVIGPPETFFIDRSGRIADKAIGPVTYGQLSDEIGFLLRGRTR